ncbi:MAG TPA: Gfo/Idh/MocA family oxidoreductase [Bryobacteraceae bacterium]|jgi:predicted dehydrogenase|nr:Gfo/Idh/MocA family oxidoreductase [Bryobacteraceae bacterium]
MLKAAIVGCGKIADAHASVIRKIPGCEIVGACDRELLMAAQLRDRFPIKECFTDVAELLGTAKPDVVHITTPPPSHFEIAKLCLEHGCHIYVEKPFTIDAGQALQLVSLAEDQGVNLTVGHNHQFSHVARRMRTLVASGYLGGAPVHLESHYCYDLRNRSYARALLGDKAHWVRQLPGGLLQNIISHGIARIAEFLTGPDPQVIAHGFVSPLLKEIGESDIVDELRVIVCDGERTTAYFTFSSQMRPSLHEFRIYGPKNGLILDHNHEILIRLGGDKFKSYADHFIPPMQFAKQCVGNMLGNVRLFLKNDFHMDAGMQVLVESFYRSIRENGPLPIPYREIVLTARIMDAIFEQVGEVNARISSAGLPQAAV